MVKYGSTVVLIDVGIPGKYVMAGLERNGLDLPDVDGILVTHEHTDHVQSIRMISRRAENAVVHASRGTLLAVQDRLPEDRTHEVHINEDFYIGEILVVPFDLSHDATEPMGYSLLAGDRQVTVVTDTGYLTEEIMHHIRTADLLVLEANHEVNILKMGPYPWPLKQRILGEEGHLSNEAAARAIIEMLAHRREDRPVPKILLAHLSRENNTPQQAYITVQNLLFEEGFYVNRDLELSVLPRDDVSPLIEV
jgi:phosphoribosyl 1,2-cyclic phosphodiesterase